MKSDKFRALLASKPDSELFQFSLGQALMEEGRGDEAVERFDICILKKPDWMMASILKSKCLIRLGKTDLALSELNRALKLSIEQRHEAPEAEIRQLIRSLNGEASTTSERE